jgi:hypothetical protein
MNKRKVYIITIFLIVLGLLWILRPEKTKIDGLSGEIWNLMFATDTKYAKGYSDKAFNKIEIGMTEEEVLNLIGEPLTRWTPFSHTNSPNKAHYIGLQYSESPSSTNYRLRQVYINNGVVAEVIGYFYVD